jgi:hypothetical protein
VTAVECEPGSAAGFLHRAEARRSRRATAARQWQGTDDDAPPLPVRQSACGPPGRHAHPSMLRQRRSLMTGFKKRNRFAAERPSSSALPSSARNLLENFAQLTRKRIDAGLDGALFRPPSTGGAAKLYF